MRVLWFTNVPFPAACVAAGRRAPVIGGWLPSLWRALKSTGGLDLRVVSLVAGGSDQDVEADGCSHRMIAIEQSVFCNELWFEPSERVRKKCLEAITSWSPDVVHIHGTESSYGLLVDSGAIHAPVVISLQGILGPIHRFDSGGIPLVERLRYLSIRDLIGRGGFVRGSSLMRRRIQRVESKVLRCNADFVGRTDYDRACLRAANPSAKYHHCDEVLRAEFYEQRRDPQEVIPGAIFAPLGGLPRKGLHCLLKALALLKRDFPGVYLRVPGVVPSSSMLQYGYARYVSSLIQDLGLMSCVEFLGELTAERVAFELRRAQVFAFPSFADNSPNSLAEAMLIGTPVVAAFVGGVPSMVRHGETALCFPVGDEIVMAECLRRVITDEVLADRLAKDAQQLASVRHDAGRVARRMIDIYSMVTTS